METSRSQTLGPEPFQTVRRPLLWALSVLALVSFLLLVQNYGLTIFPNQRIEIRPEEIHPLPPEPSHAYFIDYDGSAADEWLNRWSRARLFEGDKSYEVRTFGLEAVRNVGGDYWAHEPGRIVFAATDNSDPRRNGRRYSLVAPILYSRAIANGALLAYAIAVAGLCWMTSGRSVPATGAEPSLVRWRWHLLGASFLFLVGLYCNTGTLSPYAVTGSPKVDPATGYLFNTDHAHFRVLFNFVDGRRRAVWDGAILLRRILFPILAWPLMKLAGFEVGGILTSIFLNLAGYVAGLELLRRRIGGRGAIFAAWILALYPGAGYWAGLPYVYGLIFPESLLLMLCLCWLSELRGWRLVAVSLAMGVAYLGYDLAVLFVPAAFALMLSRRRWRAALVSAALQLAPSAIWMILLRGVFHQPFTNSNTTIYGSTLSAYSHLPSLSEWWPILQDAPRVGLEIFFGSNFIFLPLLFVAVLALNPLTTRIRFLQPEIALFLVSLGLFAFLNLAPPYRAGWMMRGTWIARLYQPVFPALVLFVARWWGGLPPLSGLSRALVGSLLAIVTLGDALVVFGPILGNPLGVSEAAFYRFYNDTDIHTTYEHNLAAYGRRPLGFIRPQPPDPTAEEGVAGIKNQIIVVNRGIAANQAVLARNESDLSAAARDLSTILAKMDASRQQQLSPRIRALIDAWSTPPGATASAAVVTVPPGGDLGDARVALGMANSRLSALEKSVLQAQADLAAMRAEDGGLRAELSVMLKLSDRGNSKN